MKRTKRKLSRRAFLALMGGLGVADGIVYGRDPAAGESVDSNTLQRTSA